MKHLIPIIIILLMVSTSFVGVSYDVEKSTKASFDGNTLYVGGDGPGNYTSIQHAVNDANDGDTVFVYNGTYIENIHIEKSLNIIGQGRETTFVYNLNPSEYGVFHLKESNIVLKGFTIRAGQSGVEVGWDIPFKNITIEECNIWSNGLYGGIWLGGVLSDIYIENCYFFDNKGLAVRIEGSISNVKFINCHFDGDEVHGWGDYFIFENCEFDDSGVELVLTSDYSQFLNCTFKRIYSYRFSYIYIYPGSYQIIKNCTFDNCGAVTIDLYETNEATIQDCVISNNIYDDVQGICFIGNNLLLENVTIKGFDIGLYIFRGGFNIEVKKCNFINNVRAVQYFAGGKFNKFIQNNFINNKCQFFNEDLLFMLNYYNNNYWDTWRGCGPYRVYGLLNWDWHPAKEPYDIGV